MSSQTSEGRCNNMNKLCIILSVCLIISVLVAGCIEESPKDLNEKEYLESIKKSIEELNDKDIQTDLNAELGKNNIKSVVVGGKSVAIHLDEYNGKAKSDDEIRNDSIYDISIIINNIFKNGNINNVSILIDYPMDKLDAYKKLSPEDKETYRIVQRGVESIGSGNTVIAIKMSRESFNKAGLVSSENLKTVCDSYWENFEIKQP